jgi:hypothetical protein
MSQDPVVFHEASPNNLKTAYSPSDQVNFTLSNAGRSFQCGSLSLEGVWAVNQGGEPFGLTATSNVQLVYYDRFLGAHSVIEQISVEAGGQTLENVQNYRRLVKSLVTATESQTTMFRSKNVHELKTCGDEFTREILMGDWLPLNASGGGVVPAVQRADPDFSIRPVCLLNGGFGSIPYRRSGDIGVSFNVARAAEAMWGPNMAAGTSYTLTNLRVTWRSVPDDGSNVPVSLTKYDSLSPTIQSSNASLQMRVPAVCDAMFMNFLPTNDKGKLVPNTSACHRLPNVSRVQYLFNSSTNRLITYQLRNELEILEKYVDALSNGSETSAVTLRNVKANETYGIGLSFDGQINLNTSTMSVIIESDINNGNTYSAYTFFRSRLVL